MKGPALKVSSETPRASARQRSARRRAGHACRRAPDGRRAASSVGNAWVGHPECAMQSWWRRHHVFLSLLGSNCLKIYIFFALFFLAFFDPLEIPPPSDPALVRAANNPRAAKKPKRSNEKAGGRRGATHLFHFFIAAKPLRVGFFWSPPPLWRRRLLGSHRRPNSPAIVP